MKLRQDDQESSTPLRKFCEACGAKLYNNQTCPYPTCSSHEQTKPSSKRSSSQQAINKTPDNKRQQQVGYYGEQAKDNRRVPKKSCQSSFHNTTKTATSKMTGKLSFNEKLHKYLQSLASKPGQGLPIKGLPTHQH